MASGTRTGIATLVVAAVMASAIAGAASATFSDVTPGEWYAESVEWLVGEGLTTGTRPGCFEPDKALTRAEAAVFLHRLAGEPPAPAPHPFVDVSADWQQNAIAWLAANDLTTGVAPDRFAPDDPITRGQFATLLHRYVDRPPAPPHDFTDVSAIWQDAGVAWLADTGITTGTSSTTFSPDRVVTRAQLATLLHRHAGSPTPTPDDSEPTLCRRPLIIHGVGDVNFDPGYGPNPQRPYSHAWSGLDGLFLTDDLTIINLECAPSTLGSAVPKTYNFRCPLDALPPARAAGVDVANLANNHGGDFGTAALLDSAVNSAAAGIQPVGVGTDLASAITAAFFERNDTIIAVLGFNTIGANPEWRATPVGPGMAPGDIPTMVRAVEAAAAQADLVFVTIHWGVEKSTTPAADDIPRARALIDAGADAIFGHHSHRLQPLEYYNERPIFWSLGNFVWHARTRETAVAEVIVGLDGTVTGRLMPALITEKGHPELAG